MNQCLLPQTRWLLLIHQIPPKPDYFRVRIWRRLQQLGAVSLKNSVYVLPRRDQTLEDFQWVQREIVKGGGDASVCEASFIEGFSEQQIEALFRTARDADYRKIEEEAENLLKKLPAGKLEGDRRGQAKTQLAHLTMRFEEVVSRDFFSAPGQRLVKNLLTAIDKRLQADMSATKAKKARPIIPKDVRGHTWVTRKGIHVDRMASAWLIRRFINPTARFKFVSEKNYHAGPKELRFDMFEAEFTHEGDRCTFEVLIDKFRLEDPALRPLAEIVHDIDLKDLKFGRQEVVGVDHVIAGIAMKQKEDEARLDRGVALFDELYEYFRRKNP